MRMGAFLLVAVASLVAPACGGSDARAPSSPSAPRPPTQPVFAVAWGPPGHGELFQADPQTLEPLAARPRVDIGSGSGGAWVLSPDQRILAVGTGEGAAVQLVDVAGMRSLARIELLDDGYVDVISWPEPSRMFVNIPSWSALVAVVDPVKRRLLEIRRLPDQVVAAKPTRDGLALLLGPSQRIGPARLALVTASGVRFANLPEIRAGWESVDEGGEFATPHQASPGLTIDPSGTRALVVPAGRLVAEVNLGTLAVRYHSLAEHVSLLGRLLDWLDPPAYAKAISGPSRSALWLNHDVVAVTGIDIAATTSHAGTDIDVTPAGLSLIDTSDWSVRSVNDETSDMTLAGGTLLAFGGPNRIGLVGYDLDGHERFHLFKNEEVAYVLTAGGYAYIGSDNSTFFRLVDLHSGRPAGTAATAKPTILVP